MKSDLRLSNGHSPCYKCQDRWRTDTQTCHSACQFYADYKAEEAEKAEKKRREKSKTCNFWGYVFGKGKPPRH